MTSDLPSSGLFPHAGGVNLEAWSLHPSEIDEAIRAVRDPSSTYDPAALTLAEAVERLRAQLDRFEGNAAILSCSTIGEAYDRIGETLADLEQWKRLGREIESVLAGHSSDDEGLVSDVALVVRERDEARAQVAELTRARDAATARADNAEAQVAALTAELETYRRDDRHIIDLRADGWTVQHPMACRPNLFDCPVNKAAGEDLTAPPAELGQFYCDVLDGWFAILDRVPASGGAGETTEEDGPIALGEQRIGEFLGKLNARYRAADEHEDAWHDWLDLQPEYDAMATADEEPGVLVLIDGTRLFPVARRHGGGWYAGRHEVAPRDAVPGGVRATDNKEATP